LQPKDPLLLAFVTKINTIIYLGTALQHVPLITEKINKSTNK